MKFFSSLKYFRLLAFVAMLCVVQSCFRHEQPQESNGGEHVADGSQPGAPPPPPMQVRLEQSRMADTVIVADVMGSGVPVTFVASLDTTKQHPAGTRFDRVQRFTWSTQDSEWHEASSDTFAFATAIAMEDLTGDGKPDMVISTTSGLDDSLASIGCTIFSAHGGTWKQLLSAQTGNPVLLDIDGNGTLDVVLHDAYDGVMPETEAIGFISEIYTFDGTTFISATQRFPKYFETIIAAAKENYARIKTQVPVDAPIADEFDFTLYKPCATVLINYQAANNMAGAKEFWNQEKEYLSRMVPAGQFIDLESIVGEN